mgnify:CR=1 FL=1
MILLKVAWKNIWRNKVRSLVVISAICLGLWAGVFGSAFVQGMMKSKIEAVIHTEISHIQFHAPGFRDEFNGKLFIPNSTNIAEKLANDNEIEAVSERVISMGMLASANKNSALRLVGINPSDEKKVTNIHTKLVEGSYFETNKKRPIVISKKTADDFKIKLNSKVVFTMQDVHGVIKHASFRVVGIYQTSNNMYDKMTAFVDISQLKKLYELENGSHEIAVWLKDHDQAEIKAKGFQENYQTLEVKPWMDLSSGMRMMIEAFDVYLYFIVGIILFALLFSILNTMLMAVLERVREIGMLMAIGMAKKKVFIMIMYETVFMTMIGVPIGFLLSWISIQYTGSHGIDLSGAAYENQGFESIIYPYLEAQSYVEVTIMVLIMSIAAAIYPALKALKLRPVEAIRKV